MEKFSNILDEKLASPMARLAEQRHLRAVRDGIIATLPLIIFAKSIATRLGNSSLDKRTRW